MPKLVNEDGIRYLEGLRSPPKADPEVKKIAIELPEVPCLSKEDNPCNWDLVFICSDGVVFAHRLVISNASKYISFMLDDQPPWVIAYIHVLDLPRFIVQLLVDLAYTGEMRMNDELKSDVFDAMHTLGWVHTDCLSADFDGVGESYVYHGEVIKSPKKEEKPTGTGKENKSETEMTMSFLPVDKEKSPHRPSLVSDRNSFAEEEESMEISQLPDVEWSDVEDADAGIAPGTPKKKTPGRTGKSKTTSKGKIQKERANENVVQAMGAANTKDSLIGQATRKRSRKTSFSESNEVVVSSPVENSKTTAEDDVDKAPAEPNSKTKPKGRPGRKTKPVSVEAPVKINPEVPIMDETSQTSSFSESSSILDSPSKRQRRKPKRFEEYEELDKPKPRSSPSKPQEETKGTRGKKNLTNSLGAAEPQTENSRTETKELTPESCNDDEVANTPKSNAISENNDASSSGKGKKTASKSVAKKKLSEDAPKNSLITSYFSKRDSLDEQKQENNKKSSDLFDDIRSSHINETEKCDNNGNGQLEDLQSAVQKAPARKSSRVASKPESNDETESKNEDGDDDEIPKPKRMRKESVDVTGTTVDQGSSAPSSRRSSLSK